MTVKTYDWQYPAFAQNDPWSCMPTSTRWALWAYGRTPSEQWIESTMIAEGVVSVDDGCLDASGAGVAAFLNRHYGEDGYAAESVDPVSFDELAAEAATYKHPIVAGGRGWYHWTGVRGYDASTDLLLLANPAAGWQGINQTMDRSQFAQLGSFSMVRITHPESEMDPPPPDDTPWHGKVGTGLLDMMAVDQTLPAQASSTWLPLGKSPADVEECLGQNGVYYRWDMARSAGYRYPPA